MRPKARAAPPHAYHHGDLRRALVEAAIALIHETQNWEFSLREVARTAGVTHNAPYAHFRTKHELLIAISAVGFQKLRARMLEAATHSAVPGEQLTAIGLAYLAFAQSNPAHYRLMFGPTLSGPTKTVSEAVLAARDSRAVLSEVITRGALDGSFNVDPQDPVALVTAVFAAWSIVHGLTLLFIDGLAADETNLALPELAHRISRLFAEGLQTPVRTRAP